MAEPTEPSATRPYLIRALYEWCTDNGFTPHLAVKVDANVQVPHEYVKDGEIVLNVGFDAISALKLGNEWIEFKARFSGVPREIIVPVSHVLAIYARENGQGMAFTQRNVAAASTNAAPAETESTEASPSTPPHPSHPPTAPSKPTHLTSVESPTPGKPPPPKSPSRRPILTRVK